MKERYKKRPFSETDKEYLEKRGFNSQIAQALSSRGICEENFETYFGDKQIFHSPFEMVNMREAAETVSCLIDAGGSVLICGDYDADGLTASSILSLFLSDNGVENKVLIPTRDEGYGLHAEKVIKAFEENYYDLIITVDCGISNRDEIEKITEALGVEIIVTDHHELPEILPDCLCVNPKMGYPFHDLAGAGVAWKLVEALIGRDAAAKYAYLAAIGTIGDLMPMMDENRSIVKLGLSNRDHKGLEKLAELSRCNEDLTAYDVAMKIAPKINAAGRMGSPLTALELLLCRDKADVRIVNELLALNEERKIRLEKIVEEAESVCDAAEVRENRMVFLSSENWQHGLLGIVAARFKEKYNLPCLVMTLDGDCYVGSARGIDGIDLFDLFCKCKEYLVKFGGHKASVGFSVDKNKLTDFKNAMICALKEYSDKDFEKYFYYDVEIGKDCNAADLLALSDKLQPLLPQDKLICRVRDSVKFANAFGRDNSHLSATLSSGLEVKGFFKYGHLASLIRNGADVDLLCSVENDAYTKSVCGVIEDITIKNSVCFDEMYRLNWLKNFYPCEGDGVNADSVGKLLACENTLAIFDDYETYLKYSEQFDFGEYFVDIFFDSGFSNKTVAISPVLGYNYSKYRNIVYFTLKNTCRDFGKNVSVFNVEPANVRLYELELSRSVCAAAFSAIKVKSKFDSVKGAYDKYVMGKIGYDQYSVALRIFEELKFIKIADKYAVEFDNGVKSELTNSKIYSFFKDTKTVTQ